MRESKTGFKVPPKTLGVSRARYQLSRLLRRLRNGSRIYLITQSGKPAGALVNLRWLETLMAQVRGKQHFSLFGQATVTEGWQETLTRLRQTLAARTVGRYPLHH